MVVLAGPNGAGKTTAAPLLLHGALGVDAYVNADVIAQGLSGFAPHAVAFEAGEIMLRRIRDLAAKRMSFAFETTLAGKSTAAELQALAKSGCATHLLFIALRSADIAVQRVKSRVLQGGHDVP